MAPEQAQVLGSVKAQGQVLAPETGWGPGSVQDLVRVRGSGPALERAKGPARVRLRCLQEAW